MQFSNNSAIYSSNMYFDKNLEETAKKISFNKDLKSKSCIIPCRKTVGKIYKTKLKIILKTTF